MAYHGWIVGMLDQMIEYAHEQGLKTTERELSEVFHKVKAELGPEVAWLPKRPRDEPHIDMQGFHEKGPKGNEIGIARANGAVVFNIEAALRQRHD